MPHIHYLFDFVVGAFVVHEGKVLLIHHKKLGLWLCPGGHVELDEDPEAAVHREVLEETGLGIVLHGNRPPYSDPRARQLVAPPWLDVHPINDVHKHIGLFWPARLAPGQDPTPRLAPGEHFAVGWFLPDRLPDPMWESTRWYCREAVSTLSGAGSGGGE
jgi:8-oxo-dGTP pyrophosphatase MutT (NUDIX family)